MDCLDFSLYVLFSITFVLLRVCWLHNKLFTPQYFLLKSSSISLLLHWSNLHLSNKLQLTSSACKRHRQVSQLISVFLSFCLPVSLACLANLFSDVCSSVLVNHLFVYPPSVISVCCQLSFFSVCCLLSFISLFCLPSAICNLSIYGTISLFDVLSVVCQQFFCRPLVFAIKSSLVLHTSRYTFGYLKALQWYIYVFFLLSPRYQKIWPVMIRLRGAASRIPEPLC